MSGIKSLCEDDARGGGLVAESPTRQRVLEAFSRLDGKRYTLLGLEVDEERQMYIGGGGGRYVVSIYLGDRNKVLCDPTKSEDGSEWVVCGQGSSYPSSMVVDEQSARQAMLNFFDTGGLWDPTLFWDEM